MVEMLVGAGIMLVGVFFGAAITNMNNPSKKEKNAEKIL